MDNFNPTRYKILKKFWKKTIEEITGQLTNSYIHNFYANGKEIMDANPIYSTLINDDKAIRIIQVDPDSQIDEFICWADKLIINEKEINELVISVVLTTDTFNRLKLSISQFLLN